MSKGTIAILVSVWFTVAGTGIALAALINASTARLDDRITRLDDRITRLDDRITRLDDRITELAEDQAEIRERLTRVETILGDVRMLAALRSTGSGPPGPAASESEGPRSLP